MRIGSRKSRRTTARLTGSVAVALFVALAIALPAMAAQGPTRLSDASVSPDSGTTATTFTLSVTYKSLNDSPADLVKVKVGSKVYDLTRTTAADWKKGVRFSWSGKLVVGTHTVTFISRSKDKFDAALAGGSVVVKVPPTPPPPKATPKPTPKPTPRPTARPTREPVVTPRSTSDRTTPRPTATSRPGLLVPTPTPTPTLVDWLVDWPAPDPGPADTPSPSDDPTTIVGGFIAGLGSSGPGGRGGSGSAAAGSGGGPGGAGGGGTWGPVSNALATLGLTGPGLPPVALAPTLVTTTGVVVSAMAFGVFGRRRRDGDPPAPDEVLAAEAALGISVAMAGVMSDRPGPNHNAGAGRPPDGAAVAAIASPLDAESALPRWRRPSLLEARKADPVRDAAVAPRLSFDRGLVGPLDGRERRLIRYNVVRLLDVPDELRGVEIGFLDQGDEVQLLERQGTYWLVLCPNGGQGWIHKMTLGEVVADEDAPQANGAMATMPIAADTWTMGDDVDDDVLSAYIKSRERRD